MQYFEVHTSQTAPAASGVQLRQIAKSFGFIPNLAGILAEAPAALEAYFTLGRLFDQTSLTSAERQVVLLAVSRENRCEYCVAAHTVVARMQKVPEAVIEAVREDERIPDSKLEALRAFTVALVRKRGHLADADLQAFLDAGFTKQNVLEVIVGLAMKTVSNYTNHIAGTPLDEAFAAAAWSPAACVCH